MDHEKMNQTAPVASGGAPSQSDKEKKKKRDKGPGKWSAVDTVILLLVIVALAGIVARVVYAYRTERPADTGASYEVYFTVEDVYATVLEEIEAEDTVYLYGTDTVIGCIAKYPDGSAAITPGEAGSGETAGRVSAQGCMICINGELVEDSLLLQDIGRYLASGSSLQIRTDRVMLTVTVTEIRRHA